MSTTRFVAVLGMHRSGTSALTRALNMMGVALPGELMHNTQHNASGHWEALEAVRIHDALLAANDYTWDDPHIPVDICTRDAQATLQANRDIDAFIQAHIPAQHTAALKDPRICHMLPLWIERLHAAQIMPCAIIMVRNPLEVAASLQARDGMPTLLGLQLWLRYMLAAERNTRGIPRVVVRYEALVDDWQTALAAVCDQLDMPLPSATSELGRQLSTFLSRNERHHTYDADALTHGATHIPAVVACYAQSTQAIDTPQAHTAFDGIQAELTSLDNAISPLVHEAMRYRTRQALQEIATLKADIAWRSSVMHAQSDEIAWRKSVMVARRLEP